MSILDDIRRDMEAGTRGPWFISGSQTVRAGESAQNVLVCKCHWECGTANARRIARVPQLEAIALAAGELAHAAECLLDQDPAGQKTPLAFVTHCLNGLAALRKAMEAAE